MDGIVGVILVIALLIGFVFLMRAIGSWMLRIDEVIDHLKVIRNQNHEQLKVQKETLDFLRKSTSPENAIGKSPS